VLSGAIGILFCEMCRQPPKATESHRTWVATTDYTMLGNQA